MADNPEVTLPVVGTQKRRTVLIGAAAVTVIVVVAYFMYARRPRSSTTTVATDPATGTLSGPSTYANPAPRVTAGTIDTTGGQAITTDDQWALAVTQLLVDAGWDRQYVVTTLGAYLAGSPLDTNQANMIQAAWALKGRPPSNRNIVMTSGGGSTPGASQTIPPAGQQGQYVYVGTASMTASGSAAPIGNTYAAIASQIYGHAEYAGSIKGDPTNANVPSEPFPAGTAVWVSGIPGRNP
jgi:hypothetical protein